MNFPARELLQVALGSCVALAVVILMREVVSLARKFRASREFSEEPPSAPSLTALEAEVE
jgi:hypothetical protein